MNHQNNLIQNLKNERIAFLTRHQKEKLLSPIFHQNFGCSLIHTDNLDTDTLGTFTREIPRQGTQREAARKKAELGAHLTGCRFGIGSEGAFITDPWTGMMPWNLEMVLLLDTKTGLEITGIAQGAGMCQQREVKNWESLQKFSEQAGFPYHRLVIRPDGADQPLTAKGISNMDELRKAFDEAMLQSRQQQVFVENDLRAHCNPSRQAMIVNAAKNLIERIASSCPNCQMPDFWISSLLDSKPCRNCGMPTRVTKAEIWSCQYCKHSENRERNTETFAEPAYCQYCNP